jgi:hypothetical protein
MARFWFNSEAIKKLMSDGARVALMRAGAFVRRTAVFSIRSSRKGESAKPGRPPKSHVGSLRNLIVFEWDSDERQVVIGPKLLKRTRDGNTVPHLLEFSGTTTIIGRRKGEKKRGPMRARYRAFPFMAPALAKNLPKIVKMFAGALIGPAAENVSIGPGGTSGS